MKKQTITIIALSIIIISMSGVYAYNQVQEKSYQQGVQDAILLINQQILNSLQQNGYVPFIYTIGDETQTVNLAPLRNENEIM